MRRKVTLLVLGLAAAGTLPTPASSLTCETGPFIIFFDADRAYVSPASQIILDNALSAVGNCAYFRTSMTGHTDTSEVPGIGDKRLRAVRAYFVARGIPEDDIQLQNFGSTRLRIVTPADTSEKENRRVEVTFGPWEDQ